MVLGSLVPHCRTRLGACDEKRETSCGARGFSATVEDTSFAEITGKNGELFGNEE
jgi:hypothetical protein